MKHPPLPFEILYITPSGVITPGLGTPGVDKHWNNEA